MTHKEIDQLEAGPTLDGLIAKHIFGCDVITLTCTGDVCCQCPEIDEIAPHGSGRRFAGSFVRAYSTDIAAAWLVVEKLKDCGFSIQVGANSDDFKYECYIDSEYPGPAGRRNRKEIILTRQETAPLAICRAALKTIIGEQS